MLVHLGSSVKLKLNFSVMQQKRVNELCRKQTHRIAFYSVDVRGTCGSLFVDLRTHAYTSKVLTATVSFFTHAIYFVSNGDSVRSDDLQLCFNITFLSLVDFAFGEPLWRCFIDLQVEIRRLKAALCLFYALPIWRISDLNINQTVWDGIATFCTCSVSHIPGVVLQRAKDDKDVQHELSYPSLEVCGTKCQLPFIWLLFSCCRVLWKSTIVPYYLCLDLLIFATCGQESLSVRWSSFPKRTSKLLFALRCECYETILQFFLRS